MSQFIPNKIITINERDPPCLTKVLKTRSNQSIEYTTNSCHMEADQRKKEYKNRLGNETNRLIVNAKDDYFYNLGQKLSDPSLGRKSYWMVLKKILNKKKYTNIPLSHPYSMTISLCQIFKQKPTCLMTFL